jgi:hypothetical protein
MLRLLDNSVGADNSAVKKSAPDPSKPSQNGPKPVEEIFFHGRTSNAACENAA